METKYTALDNGNLFEVELASLHDNGLLIGDVQIQYYTNGIKNFARIERVRILDEHQNNEKHYGSVMMSDAVGHIEEYKPSFDTSIFNGLLASDASDINDRLSSAESRGIDRIHLECDQKLEGFYSRSNFETDDDLVMKIEIHKPGYSSLE